jgi:hypothetical protein
LKYYVVIWYLQLHQQSNPQKCIRIHHPFLFDCLSIQ